MDDFDRYLNEQMKDPDFKKEWDENEARYQLMMMVLRRGGSLRASCTGPHPLA